MIGNTNVINNAQTHQRSMHENLLSPLLSTPTSPQIAGAAKSISSSNKSPLPYTTSNVDDFMQTTRQQQTELRERKVSNSSDDNPDYEPYSRRDFRMDFKSSTSDDKAMTVTSLNDTPTSGYFTSPSETKEMNTFSPESSDYERFDHQKQIIKKREEYSSSPVDSQRSTSSLCRKSVSFDLDVEEYTPPYNPNDDSDDKSDRGEHYADENVFYEKSRFHQQQHQPKRIKGILRASSPNVYYHPSSQNRVIEKEFIEIEQREVEDDYDEEIEKENPFRKEYLSPEKLNAYDDETQQQLSLAGNLTSDSDQSDIRNLNKTSKIPVKKTIFKATGNLVDKPTIAERPKLPPPPRPPRPQVKVAEMVKNEGLERMSKQMEEDDFMEFVHDIKTNTIKEVKSHENFNPENCPLPPIPRNPPPPLNLKRLNSRDRPKDSPPAPPTPIARTPTSEILEILPATFENLPRKQTANFVNENSQLNVLVTETEHREILLTENELRNAILSEYDEKSSSDNNILISNFSSTNPFLDDASTSTITSFSYGSSPNLLSPVSTLEKSSQSSGQYTPVYRDIQQVSPINILPPQPQVLPVHYGQLPKPQHPNYSHQLPVHYNPSGFSNFPNQQQQQPTHQYVYQPEVAAATNQSRSFLVSGDGQNNFYVTHNVNNTNNNTQPLLMQSAYMPSPTIQHFASSSMQQLHFQPSLSQAQNNNYSYNQPPSQMQVVYEHQMQHSELSPIRVNQLSQNNFMYASNDENEQKKKSMSSFGKQTEV